jgi:hypothetical protein
MTREELNGEIMELETEARRLSSYVRKLARRRVEEVSEE